MHETYIIPWYKKIGYFFLYELQIIAMILFICLTMGAFAFEGGLSNMIEGTVFGTVPLWFTFFAAFMPISPFFAFALYFGMAPKKYDLEWRKLKYVPINPHDSKQVLFEPRKIDGKEPLWRENNEFDTTFHLVGTKNFPTGRGLKSYMVLGDEDDRLYLMEGYRFNELLSKMIDGKYTGKFKFDVSWRWPSIMEVENDTSN